MPRASAGRETRAEAVARMNRAIGVANKIEEALIALSGLTGAERVELQDIIARALAAERRRTQRSKP